MSPPLTSFTHDLEGLKGATGWGMQEKALNPAVEEQQRILAEHGSELSMEVLNEMEVLQRNIQEALRLFPPLIMLMRYAKEPFSVTTSKGAEYTIPKVSAPSLASRPPSSSTGAT